MAPPHTAGSTQPSGSSTSSNDQFICQTCNKVLKSAYTLRVHQQTHQKSYKCDICGQRFARADQVEEHKHFQHGINTSAFICYIKSCRRYRLGLKTEASLKHHLERCHQGATLADNDRAAEGQGIQVSHEAEDPARDIFPFIDEEMSISEDGDNLEEENDANVNPRAPVSPEHGDDSINHEGQGIGNSEPSEGSSRDSSTQTETSLEKKWMVSRLADLLGSSN